MLGTMFFFLSIKLQLSIQFLFALIENNFELTVDVLLEAKAFGTTKFSMGLWSFRFVSGALLQLTSRQS